MKVTMISPDKVKTFTPKSKGSGLDYSWVASLTGDTWVVTLKIPKNVVWDNVRRSIQRAAARAGMEVLIVSREIFPDGMVIVPRG